MLRSTQSFLKQAAKISRPSISSTAPRACPSSNHVRLPISCRSSSTDTSSSSSDYDQIMLTTVSDFFSAASDTSSSPTSSSSTSYSTYSPMSGADTDMGVIENNVTKSNPNSLDEPTGCEDYDMYELHHPPCERAHEHASHASYYDASYDPGSQSGGEMGSII
mmetsp:Transcript_16417/g.29816  ORF Transcript_16417/g.29816 Transcript_16417/m.29816 type:complete len:163 (+) Transcript_16417:232-720(+)|eukprot:CAMPEP_0201872880 /NCGR_PEP_ID=MMETSP0902-20130614/5498_1 /ASSEMBLY_ACC=CAM_ASM_000551 /TAXON_ID=420261 /ORGANISM="Thalassiosira antarctica, Strain CCMP982" /LENGTH=162 /DNA_ID=CAMNT_0048399301 /DNA_START=187 /DNA_END=675 /DNA_ORIENTATION=+